jgi:SAM-dependent methyltransferase
MTADAWNKLFSDRTWGRYPSEDLVRFVARTFGNGEGKSALEVGCGPGANLWYLAREGFETCGVDLSPVAVEQHPFGFNGFTGTRLLYRDYETVALTGPGAATGERRLLSGSCARREKAP